jgi:hypothetical protein
VKLASWFAFEDERTDGFYVRYIARVPGAIAALELEAEFDNRVPRTEEVDYNLSQFQ